jgi:hypothetical protein
MLTALVDERHVRVLERRLACEYRPTFAPSRLAEQDGCVSSAPRGLDDEHLRLLALLDPTGATPSTPRMRSTRPRARRRPRLSTTLPSATRLFSSSGVPSATISPFAITAMRSQSASASNM